MKDKIKMIVEKVTKFFGLSLDEIPGVGFKKDMPKRIPARQTIVACVVIGLMVWFSDAKGARPFATDDAGTVEANRYELEVSYEFGRAEGRLGLGFKHGLTQKMDIGVSFGYTVVSEPKNRLTAAELCLKYALIPDLFSTSLTNELGTSGYDINAILTKAFGPIETDANLGYSATGDTTCGSISYALAVVAGFDKFDIGTEASGNKDGLQNWLIGGRYKLKEGVNLDIGISSTFKAPRVIIGTFGFHYEF